MELELLVAYLRRADDGRYFDTATIHHPQTGLTHYTRKVHIPSGEGYHETDFFEGAIEYPVHDLEAVKVATPNLLRPMVP